MIWVDTRYGNDQATTGCSAQRQQGTEGGEEQEVHRPYAQEDAHGARQAGRRGRQAQAHGRHPPQDQERVDEDRPEARPRRPLQDGPRRAGQEARREVAAPFWRSWVGLYDSYDRQKREAAAAPATRRAPARPRRGGGGSPWRHRTWRPWCRRPLGSVGRRGASWLRPQD